MNLQYIVSGHYILRGLEAGWSKDVPYVILLAEVLQYERDARANRENLSGPQYRDRIEIRLSKYVALEHFKEIIPYTTPLKDNFSGVEFCANFEGNQKIKSIKPYDKDTKIDTVNVDDIL